MAYQLWDTVSRNLIDEFDVEQEAIEAARAYLTPDEHGETVDVALIVYGETNEPIRSIHGDELARLVSEGPSAGSRRLA